MRALLFALATLAATSTAAIGDEALLRKAWTLHGGQSAATLKEAQTRFSALVERWPQDGALQAAPAQDAEGRWLLEHPMALYLVLDGELAAKPKAARRTVALRLTAELQWKNLGQYLPEMLSSSKEAPERLEIVQCMAALHDPKSLQALQSLLASPPEGADEALMTAAVRGLGLSRLPRYLPGINDARSGFATASARLTGTEAAWLCGDANAIAEVGQWLSAKDVTDDLRADAVRFLGENFNDQALALLVSCVTNSQDEPLAVTALQALVTGSGYDLPPPGQTEQELPAAEGQPAQEVKPAAEQAQPAAELAQPQTGRAGVPPDIRTMSADQRKELARRIATWWANEGREFTRQRRAAEVN
jgi:hypothetical protein